MLLLDVNVLLGAQRFDHPDHAAVRAWFDNMLADELSFTVPTMLWGSFLRLTTNRRIFTVPTPRDEAFAFIDAVRTQPGHVALDPGQRHVHLLRNLCEEADVSGDLVPDAVIAAVAREHGLEIVTLDRDFARFSSVRHRRPVLAAPC